MTKYYNIKTAIDSKEIANEITKSLLEKRLVSSVQQKEISSSKILLSFCIVLTN